MAYALCNPKTKKALKAAVADPTVDVQVYQPGPYGDSIPKDGEVAVEGPHYPEPHRWYARVQVKDGIIVKVLS